MPNKFEAWKQGLTLEEFAEIALHIDCHVCPAFSGKYGCGANCIKHIKEWGEQDAEQ